MKNSDGVTKSGYEWKQTMRRLETEARELRYKLKAINEKYKLVAEGSGIKPQYERMSIVKSSNISPKVLQNSGEGGIIEKEYSKEGHDLNYIGKINKGIYQGVADKEIMTDEVIITNNRIEHIIERRGKEFYDEYKGYFPEIISNPDYIFKDKAANTAIASKTFIHNNTSVNLVIKLVVEGDNADYKNSIITAIKENDKRFKQRLRNNVAVYKRVDKSE